MYRFDFPNKLKSCKLRIILLKYDYIKFKVLFLSTLKAILEIIWKSPNKNPYIPEKDLYLSQIKS